MRRQGHNQWDQHNNPLITSIKIRNYLFIDLGDINLNCNNITVLQYRPTYTGNRFFFTFMAVEKCFFFNKGKYKKSKVSFQV